MNEKPNEQPAAGLNRRTFLGALGAAAAAGALIQPGGDANAQSQAYFYQDSFGNVVPAGTGAIALGIYPPPIISPQPESPNFSPNDDPPPGTCGSGANNTTYYTCGFPKFNILLIIVDQMRNPAFWLPANNGTITGQNLINQAIPNISGLANQSLSFPNYWVAATVCGPSRACLLTGLYAQQHCIFSSQGAGMGPANNATVNAQPPPLLPFNNSWVSGSNVAGFPTIANVLGQSILEGNTSTVIRYDCTWIGKWHLSCYTGTPDGNPGGNGPRDYGFNSVYSIPNTGNAHGPYPQSGNGYPSPNGSINEGVGGDFIDSLPGATTRDVPMYTTTVIGNNHVGNNVQVPLFTQINDAAIAGAFTDYWLPAASVTFNNSGNAATPLATPWFCAVSFINPHDMTDFPYTYGLCASNPTLFLPPGTLSATGFQPPAGTFPGNFNGTHCLGGSMNCANANDVMYIPAQSDPYSTLPPGGNNNAPWNWEDPTSAALQYANNGKPSLQQWFLGLKNNEGGSVQSPGAYNNTTGVWAAPTAWTTFLNYYMWMQNCVDYQVGRVLGTGLGAGNGLAQSIFAGNTVVLFTSDHGDYAGSHGLHAKGGALYEEVMNVPLYVSYPTQRQASNTGGILPYVCSSVDLLPFLYTLALGNAQWRGNNNDMIYHLAGREAIEDAVYQYSNNNNTAIIQQRRISSVPLHNNVGGCTTGCQNWQTSQPFVLHTADDYPVIGVPYGTGGNYQPSHAIAFRTVDLTDSVNNSAPFRGQNTYGGGKLGMYSYWDTCGQGTTLTAPIKPTNAGNTQYEFYNYSAHPPAGSTLVQNLQELGNQYNNASGAGQVQLYYNDFYGVGSPTGTNVQTELYKLFAGTASGSMPALQATAAVQVAFQNYRSYLKSAGSITGSDGTPGTATGCSSANNGGPYNP